MWKLTKKTIQCILQVSTSNSQLLLQACIQSFEKVLHLVATKGNTKTQISCVSISKFIADMHVEIWWSRKICFLYKRVYHLYNYAVVCNLDAHVWPSSLQHIIPLGLNYTTFRILHSLLWNRQQYIVIYCRLRTLDVGRNHDKKKER